MGHGAGLHGGEIVAQGTPADIMRSAASLTGQYLAGRKSIPMPSRRRRADTAKKLRIAGARGNNLKKVTVELPVGVFICVTGVSGSGKSTLLHGTLSTAGAAHPY